MCVCIAICEYMIEYMIAICANIDFMCYCGTKGAVCFVCLCYTCLCSQDIASQGVYAKNIETELVL